jgi:hypothetical protein
MENITIDNEWENFLSGYNNNNSLDNENFDEYEDIDEVIEPDNASQIYNSLILSANVLDKVEHPKSCDIYISTKTKIAYLNQYIELNKIFWEIPIISYALPENGVIKKQMKCNSLQYAEYEFIQNKLNETRKKYNENIYIEEHVITNIDNPEGRIKYKDIRKVSIGISRKDIVSYRCKKKSAFYNCFVLILRLKVGLNFKEFHVKVFNTGKLEIPGVQNEEIFRTILSLIINILQPFVSNTLFYKENSADTVLINSNFNCGFFINREALYDILRNKYNIQSIYDPCSYPGIQCKFYYNHDLGIQKGCQISEENKLLYKNISQISFMIFRTGSVLIVGKCDEDILMVVYNFLKKILYDEYEEISQKTNSNNLLTNALIVKDKKKKIRKKIITVDLIEKPN